MYKKIFFCLLFISSLPHFSFGMIPPWYRPIVNHQLKQCTTVLDFCPIPSGWTDQSRRALPPGVVGDNRYCPEGYQHISADFICRTSPSVIIMNNQHKLCAKLYRYECPMPKGWYGGSNELGHTSSCRAGYRKIGDIKESTGCAATLPFPPTPDSDLINPNKVVIENDELNLCTMLDQYECPMPKGWRESAPLIGGPSICRYPKIPDINKKNDCKIQLPPKVIDPEDAVNDPQAMERLCGEIRSYGHGPDKTSHTVINNLCAARVKYTVQKTRCENSPDPDHCMTGAINQYIKALCYDDKSFTGFTHCKQILSPLFFNQCAKPEEPSVECMQDSDCVAVRSNCCGCFTDKAIPISKAEEHSEKCSNTDCPPTRCRPNLDPSRAVCRNNKCTLDQELTQQRARNQQERETASESIMSNKGTR